MAVAKKLSFQWETFQKNICDGFANLQQRSEFVDMTLAADGHYVQVHQSIVALSSPYLKGILKSLSCPHPVIFLDVSEQMLCYVLEYIYTGELIIPEKYCQTFLKYAKQLQLHGLERDPNYLRDTSVETTTKTVRSNDNSSNLKKEIILSERSDNTQTIIPTTVPNEILPALRQFRKRKRLAAKAKQRNAPPVVECHTKAVEEVYACDNQNTETVEISNPLSIDSMLDLKLIGDFNIVPENDQQPNIVTEDIDLQSKLMSGTEINNHPSDNLTSNVWDSEVINLPTDPIIEIPMNLDNDPIIEIPMNLDNDPIIEIPMNLDNDPIIEIPMNLDTEWSAPNPTKIIPNDNQSEANPNNDAWDAENSSNFIEQVTIPPQEDSLNGTDWIIGQKDILNGKSTEKNIDILEQAFKNAVWTSETESDNAEVIDANQITNTVNHNTDSQPVEEKQVNNDERLLPILDDVTLFDESSQKDEKEEKKTQMDVDELSDSQSTSQVLQIIPTEMSEASSAIQFTVSNRGSLQMIMNRYIYYIHYSSKTNKMKRFRCIDYRHRHCMAFVDTAGDVIVRRAHTHNHGFHDEKIMKLIAKFQVFSTTAEAIKYIPVRPRGKGTNVRYMDTDSK